LTATPTAILIEAPPAGVFEKNADELRAPLQHDEVRTAEGCFNRDSRMVRPVKLTDEYGSARNAWRNGRRRASGWLRRCLTWLTSNGVG